MLYVLNPLKGFANTSPNQDKKSEDDSPAAEHHPTVTAKAGCYQMVPQQAPDEVT